MTEGTGELARTMPLGQVSALLVERLGEEARRAGPVLWLDRDGTYTELVDRLLAQPYALPFPLFAWRGSFLELMLALDQREAGAAREPLVVHLPGFAVDDLQRSPLLELYAAGKQVRFSLPKLLADAAHGKAPPSAVQVVVQQGGLDSLDAADAWLAAEMRGEHPGEAELSLPTTVPALYDFLRRGAAVPEERVDPDPTTGDAIERFLARRLGLLEDWWPAARAGSMSPAEAVRLRMSTFALCVEYSNDLRREPREPLLVPLRSLPRQVVEEARALAVHLRDHHGSEYERDADEVEAALVEEVRAATAEDLGRIDTLRFEDRTVFRAALDALSHDRFAAAAEFASERSEERSYWVRREPARRAAWEGVRLAAELGLACQRHAELLRGVSRLEECGERYANDGYEVDRAQRRLEQAREQLRTSSLEELPELLRALDHLRALYRRTVDAQSLAFQDVCRHHGFLPEAALRQRELFDAIVRPLANGGGTTALFLVDALRFEMGRELYEQLEREGGARFALTYRFAELPTLTEVGMNVLAPVSSGGRLRPELDSKDILGFRQGEVRVSTPETRRKVMHERVGGETCPLIPLDKLLDLELSTLRRSIARARLVVVPAEGIDSAGEKGVGLRSFEDELQRLRAAWGRLREAGVRRFVMTSDHGFLLQDDATREPLAHGRQIDARRRYVIERAAADHAGEVRVSSRDLGYEGDEVQFMFPATTAPFDTGERAKAFVHGGNSLQERIIPVITAEYRAARGGDAERYHLDAESLAAVMGLHRIGGTVFLPSNTQLGFAGKTELELRLRALDDSGVAVELVHAEGARIEGGALVAPVGKRFELLFRLSGTRELRTKLELCGATGADDVAAFVLERRFSVEVVGGVPVEVPARDTRAPREAVAAQDWLEDFDDLAVRAVFEHIAKFGAINEADATRLLGGPRRFRRFSQRFEEYAALAPFGLKIDASSGQKRYVKEGGSTA